MEHLDALIALMAFGYCFGDFVSKLFFNRREK